MFEKKDEVRIQPEFIPMYEQMGLKDFYITEKILVETNEKIQLDKPESKVGRITVVQNDVAQVDFWNSSPAKYTIKIAHLEIVSKASEREDIAAEGIGAVKEHKASEEHLLRAGIVEEELKPSIMAGLPVTPDFAKNHTPQKFDTGKPRMDLIRPEFTLALGEALGYGATKYDETIGDTPNYLKGEGFNYSRIIGSLERHIAQWKMGIDIDEESGLHHLQLAATNLMFLLTYEKTEKGVDDRTKL